MTPSRTRITKSGSRGKYKPPARVKRFTSVELGKLCWASNKLASSLRHARGMVDYMGRLANESQREEYADHLGMAHALAWAITDMIPSPKKRHAWHAALKRDRK
jgi:hypothetical protein